MSSSESKTYTSSSGAFSSGALSSGSEIVPICDIIGLKNYIGECWVNTVMTLFFFSDKLLNITQPLFLTLTDYDLNNKIDIAIENKIIPRYRKDDYIRGIMAMRERFKNHYNYLKTCDPRERTDFNEMLKTDTSPHAILKRTTSGNYAKTMGASLQKNEKVFVRGNRSYAKDNAGDDRPHILFNELMHIFDIDFGAEALIINNGEVNNIDALFDSAIGISINMDYYTKTEKIEKSGHATGFILCNKRWYYYNTNTRIYGVVPVFVKALLFTIHNGFPICVKEINKIVYLFTLYKDSVTNEYTPKSIFIIDTWYNYNVIHSFLKYYIYMVQEAISTDNFDKLDPTLPDTINHSRLSILYTNINKTDKDSILLNESGEYTSVLDNPKYTDIFKRFIQVATKSRTITFDEYMTHLNNIGIDHNYTSSISINPNYPLIIDILNIQSAPADPSQSSKLYNIIYGGWFISSGKKPLENRHTDPTEYSQVLFEAITDMDIPTVLKLLDTGINMNITYTNGNTLLIYAIKKKLEAVALKMLDKGADPNMFDNNYIYPLYHAADKGLLSVVQKLIEKGANINAMNLVRKNTKRTALYISVLHSNKDKSNSNGDSNNEAVDLRPIYINISIALIRAGARPTDSATRGGCDLIPEIKEALDNAIRMDLQRNAAVQKNALQSAAQLFAQPNERSRSRTRHSNTRRLNRRKTRRRS